MRDLIERKIAALIEENKDLVNGQTYDNRFARVFIYNKWERVIDVDLDALPDYVLLEMWFQMNSWGKGATA